MAAGPDIKAAREARGLSQHALAEAIGISQPAMKKIEDGTTVRSRFMPEIEKYLGLGQESPAMTIHRPEPQFFGARDLKVFSAAEGGPGEMVVSTRPVDIVVRPWYLEHVDDGYAVLITGDSMWPAFRPGDYAIVNPRLAPMRDEEMIFIGGEEIGEFKATIKHLLRWTEHEWKVEQYNPPEGQPREFSLTKRAWPKAVRVVGRYRR